MLDICDAEKKDLQDEIRHLKEVIKVKNQEIGILKSRLRSSETEMSELQNFLMSQVSALTAKLTHTIPAEPQPDVKALQSKGQDATQMPISAAAAVPSLPQSSTKATMAMADPS
jgi:chromosome segregation ATPase